MKLWRVDWYDEAGHHFKWTNSEVGAKSLMREIKAQHPDVDYEQVDIPTDKTGLLAWLNQNVTQAGDLE